MLERDIESVLFSRETLAHRVNEMGREIAEDYKGKSPVIIGVLRGSFMFVADLMRAMDIYATVDFLSVSSYGSGTTSSGQVKFNKDISVSLEGRDVLIVEDILDTGNTLSYLLRVLEARHPSSLKFCTLLDKPARRIKPIVADYVGFTVEDQFVVGYGLDYADRYRNLPYIGILKPEVYLEKKK